MWGNVWIAAMSKFSHRDSQNPPANVTLPVERKDWKLVLGFKITVSPWTSYSSRQDAVLSAKLRFD